MKSTQFEEQTVSLPASAPVAIIRKLYPPTAGSRAQMLAGAETEVAAHRRDSCRERTGEMSALDVLVLAELQRDALADVTFELLAAGRALASHTGGRLVVLLLGSNGACARGFPQCGRSHRPGSRRARLAAYAPEPFLAALGEVAAAGSFRAVLVAGTSIGWDMAPMLAARWARLGDRLCRA